ncbi:MAG: HD-GYP domain-containing protein [Gammaproteobacteria bacterium]|nr:HD-GYP domain-containing protein [Gammaproteobacteria bacterium]
MPEFLPPNAERLVRVNGPDIKVGMYMSFPDRPWLETRFLFQGVLLTTEKQVSEVRKECRYIFVDKEKSRTIQTAREPVPTETTAPPILKPIEREFVAAQKAHVDAGSQIQENLKRLVAGEGINVTRIRSSVKSCVKSIVTNPNALMWLGRLRNKDNYIAEHCLNVGILAIAFGRHLDMSLDELEMLGMCGMLHDVGKLEVDQKILDKPSSLSEEEFAVIKGHCLTGRDILSKDENMPKVVIEAAFGHHERMDGSGYPRGVRADSLDLYTRMISIVDTYDAITTTRCYDKSRPAAEAIKILFSCRNTQFEPILVEKFIECLGIYPTGSLVELKTGEGAVVIDSNRNSRLNPRVSIVLDEQKHACSPLIIDTSSEGSDNAERTIKRVLDENDYPVDLERVFSFFKEQGDSIPS